MRRACAVLFAAAALAVWSPARAHACKCAPPPAVADALRSAGAVFEGRVSKLTPLGDSDLVVELSVVRSWKAANTEHILLRTRQDSAACGFPFSPNESYLVYADAAPNDASLPGLEVLHCGRTKPMSEADADIAELGMGAVPVSPRKGDVVASDDDKANANVAIAEQQAKPAGAGCSRCSALGAHVQGPGPSASATLLAFSAALFWAVRRRQRRRADAQLAI